jgi:nucleoside-diphosphate-sugar epimerase
VTGGRSLAPPGSSAAMVQALLNAGHEVVGIDAFTPSSDPAAKRANPAGLLGGPRFRLWRAT